MGGAIMLSVALVITGGITAYLVGTLVRSIRNEKRAKMRLWKNFGLSLGFCALFLISWVGHAIAEWQVFTDEQAAHGEEPAIGDFLAQFTSSTLENWQSEFLQLFSFTVMAAILIHKGSAESRDSDDLIQAALKRIEDQMGTELTLREDPKRHDDNLYVIPDSFEGWALKDGTSAEPEGYYDSQEEAIEAGRQLATKRRVDLIVKAEDATVQPTPG
jgi:hypothetical protein